MNVKIIVFSILSLLSLNQLALGLCPCIAENKRKQEALVHRQAEARRAQAAIQAKAARPFGPTVTDIHFDLDGVVLDWEGGSPSAIVRKHWKAIVPKLFNPKFLWRINRIKRGAPADAYEQVFTKYGYTDLAAMINKIRFNKKVNPAVEAIIRELKRQGYNLHIATNMGVIDLNYFTNECEDTKDLFALFDKKKAVDRNDNPVAKPDHAYFEDAFANYSSGKKYRVFIDDTKRNVKAFKTVGGEYAKGIRFKSAEQLAQDLKERGMLPADFALPTPADFALPTPVVA